MTLSLTLTKLLRRIGELEAAILTAESILSEFSLGAEEKCQTAYDFLRELDIGAAMNDDEAHEAKGAMVYRGLTEQRHYEAERERRNLLDEIRSLSAENERLRAALEPMAKAADNFDGFKISNAEEWFVYAGQQSMKESLVGAITIGDLRRARAAIGARNAD